MYINFNYIYKINVHIKLILAYFFFGNNSESSSSARPGSVRHPAQPIKPLCLGQNGVSQLPTMPRQGHIGAHPELLSSSSWAGYTWRHNQVLKPIVEAISVGISSSSRGRKLIQRSDAPGLQVYSGYYLPDCFGGVALEPQAWPDAPHHSHFPSIELAAGQLYKRTVSWQILFD